MTLILLTKQPVLEMTTKIIESVAVMFENNIKEINGINLDHINHTQLGISIPLTVICMLS